MVDIKKLAQDLDLEEDEFLELIVLFIETGRADLEQLKSAFAEGNAEKIAFAAHSLKGSSANFGFFDIFNGAKEIEAKAHKNDIDSVLSSVRVLEKKLEEIASYVC
jgi:HPt (histidine-containing phosphotransfer) domain-containing protein